MEESVKAPFWKPALIYGAILGFISVFLSLVFYFIGMSNASWVGWANSVIGIALVVYLMILYRRDYLGGFASFRQIFAMAFVAGVVSTVIAALYQYILYTVIDPGVLDQLKIVAEEKIMNNSRIPESMYDDIFERMEKRTTAAYITRMALIFGPFVNAIIALIVAAFIKKEENIISPV